MRKTLLFILFPILSFGQTQIGGDIVGKYAPPQTSSTSFGASSSLSADGSVLAVGDYNYNTWSGTVWVYKNIDGAWTPLGNTFQYGGNSDEKGHSISLSDDGTILAVGSPESPKTYYSGFAQVYKLIDGIWTQIGGNIKGETIQERSGWSVSLSADGSTVAMGAPGNNKHGTNTGAAQVFRNINGTWTKVGATIYGNDGWECFGNSVSLSADGNTLAVGAYGDMPRGTVRVYKNISGTWTLVGSEINGTTYSSTTGFSVSLSSDGNTVAIGANGNTDPSFQKPQYMPPTRVFTNINSTWTQVGGDIKEKISFDYTGYSVSLSGDASILAVGSPGKNNGYTRVFQNLDGTWTQLGVDITETAYGNNGFTVSVSRDGTKVAVGSPTGVGLVKVYSLAPLLHTDSFVMSHCAVYPNPASADVTISLEQNLTLEKVNVYNTLGQLLKTEKTNNISVSSLNNGNYYFEVITDKGKATKVVIIK